ncbi:MAG: NAD(P)-dependent alcohol dehydrogenase [Aestuariibacter sp.]
MKAIVYKKYGSPAVLHIDEIDKPTPSSNEALINVLASEVTKADCEMRSFRFPVKWFWLPLRVVLGLTKPKRQVLGSYFVGEVEETGNDYAKFKAGDKVFGTTNLRLGTHGEYVCVPDHYTLVTMPENMSYAEAAAVPLGGLNALHFLNRAKIKQEEKVLINGAGGSIGIFAVQIAKAMGANVTAVDSQPKEKMLRQIGADHFIDYTKESFCTTGQQYDVILNMVATTSYSGCIRVLKPNGRYLLANPKISDMCRAVITSRTSNKSVIFAFAGEKEEELESLKTMIEAGKITSVVDTVFAYEQAQEAHRKVETEERLGAIVIAKDAVS